MTLASAAVMPMLAPAVQIVDRPAPTVTWHTFDLRTGRRGPQLTTQQLGAFGRIIGESTDCSLDVRVYDPGMETDPRYPTAAGAIPGAIAGTEPGRSLLVALDELDQPVWGGLVLRRVSTEAETVSVSCSTLEHYFGRRFVGDLSFTDTDQGQIAAGVIDGLAVDGLSFTMDAPPSGVFRDRDYFDDEDKTVLSVLQDLMGVEGGPEFTVELEWADEDHAALSYVVQVRNRIGVAPAVPVAFTMPGCIQTYTLTEDYSEGYGANDVLATSSGQGNVRPTSDHHVETDYLSGGWAKYEYRYEPSTSIIDTETLDDHAAEQLALMKDGLVEFELTANLDAAPRFGSDWHLGDDLTLAVTSPRHPSYLDADGAQVPGLTARVRCVGVSIDYDARTITPQVRLA
jgi:hypothetical protein